MNDIEELKRQGGQHSGHQPADWVRPEDGGHADPLDLNSDARARFMLITTNPEWRKFGGPCPRCGRFFIRKTDRASVFCSPGCAKQVSAIKRTAKVRAEQHVDKLRRAQTAQAEWLSLFQKGRTMKTWKAWVASRHPDITTKFLTRAVNNGEVHSPEAKRRTDAEK